MPRSLNRNKEISRIAKKPIKIPQNVHVDIDSRFIFVSGPLGKLKQLLYKNVLVYKKHNEIKFSLLNKTNNSKSMSGTIRSLIQNMISGVLKGFEKKLKLVGVGYSAYIKNKILNLQIGYSHEISCYIPESIKIECIKKNEIIIKGFDKQSVGQLASNIRSNKKPEPYKGKGIRYFNEKIKIKNPKKK